MGGVLLGDLGANRNQQKAGNCLWWVELADAQVAVTPGGTGGAPTYATPSLLMNGGLACSKMTSAAGSAVSNTATFSTVQPVVSQIGSGLAAAAKATPTPSGEALATACPTVSGQRAVAPCLATAATIM